MMALKCVVLSAQASTLHAYEHDGNRLAGTARNALELLRIFEGHPSLKGGRESFNLLKQGTEKSWPRHQKRRQRDEAAVV